MDGWMDGWLQLSRRSCRLTTNCSGILACWTYRGLEALEQGLAAAVAAIGAHFTGRIAHHHKLTGGIQTRGERLTEGHGGMGLQPW